MGRASITIVMVNCAVRAAYTTLLHSKEAYVVSTELQLLFVKADQFITKLGYSLRSRVVIYLCTCSVNVATIPLVVSTSANRI
jgi:hypothetical protein